MAQRKTAVNLLLTHWSYCSLAGLGSIPELELELISIPIPGIGIEKELNKGIGIGIDKKELKELIQFLFLSSIPFDFFAMFFKILTELLN